MNNLDYFKYSQDNKDSIEDFVNGVGVKVISETAEENPTMLMIKVNELNHLLTTYSTLRSLGKNTDDSTVLDVVDKIALILEENNLNINYSPFCVYFQVIRYSYNSYKENYSSMDKEEKRELLIYLIEEYLKNRYSMYESHGYTPIVLQVMADNSSARRNGTVGLQMLSSVLTPMGFKNAKTYQELMNTDLCFLNSDKGEKKVFDEFIKKNNIKFEFRATRDNKYPDMLIKVNNDFFILEHKLTNGGGGSQNAEINEIIAFTNYSENNSKIHYVSCLQGNFIQYLTGHSTQPKNIAQRKNIFNALSSNPNNYFVNGKGLAKVIEDYINK